MNCLRRLALCEACSTWPRRQDEPTGYRLVTTMLGVRVEPGRAIEHIQRHTTPLQVVRPMQIAVDLDVHHQRIGLLYLANLAELHVIAEAGG